MVRIVAIGGLVLTIASGVISTFELFNGTFLVGALVSYGLAASIIVMRIDAFHPYSRFGLANTVTLARLLFVCLFAGLVLELVVNRIAMPAALAWFFCALAILERLLDGLDGYVARKLSMESPFGARFDMEVDALQILLLSFAALMLDKAGAWILVGGALRYVFLGAGMVFPPISSPLPPSQRRKIIAVFQGVTLTVLLAPAVTPPFSTLAAAVALALLIYSFVTDTLWTLRAQTRP